MEEEIKHIVTEEDLTLNPELKDEGVEVGEEISLPVSKEEAEHKSREERCVPIAMEMLKIMVKHEPDLNEGSQDRLTEIYGPIYKEIAELFLEKNLTYADITWVMKIFMTAPYNVNQYILTRTQECLDLAEQKIFSVDNIDNITLRQVDEMIKLK